MRCNLKRHPWLHHPHFPKPHLSPLLLAPLPHFWQRFLGVQTSDNNGGNQWRGQREQIGGGGHASVEFKCESKRAARRKERSQQGSKVNTKPADQLKGLKKESSSQGLQWGKTWEISQTGIGFAPSLLAVGFSGHGSCTLLILWLQNI